MGSEIFIIDSRRSRDGLYFNEILDIEGFKINLIVLDTRFFRSKLTSDKFPYTPTDNPDTTILGNVQWKWFEEVIEEESDLILVLSSIQVLPTEHVFERWDLFPHERSKIIKTLNSVETKSLIISGDRHKGGLYKKDSLVELEKAGIPRSVVANYIEGVQALSVNIETDIKSLAGGNEGYKEMIALSLIHI